MAEQITEHAWVDGWCTHCGASEGGYHQTIASGYASTCLPRSTVDVMPEPKRREVACEATDEIAARIAELRAEKQAALNRSDD